MKDGKKDDRKALLPVCPLLSAGCRNDEFLCLEENCAWYIGGYKKCAVYLMGHKTAMDIRSLSANREN
jgi:hypothetical protein